MRGDWILKRLVGLAALCALLFCLWPVEAAAWPQLPADTGAVVIDAQTGRVIFGHQEHEVKPMASLTKMMTAYLTLQQPDLEAYFEVPAAAVGVEGSSMGLQLGDQVSLEALAVGQLLPSGNDAAAAAAIHIAGSEAAFAEQMKNAVGSKLTKEVAFNCGVFACKLMLYVILRLGNERNLYGHF